MKILGNRVLVSRVEEAEAEGFTTVEVQDNFVYKGRVKQISHSASFNESVTPSGTVSPRINVSDIVIFAKYSPDTQDVEIDGEMMKIINVNDILAIYE